MGVGKEVSLGLRESPHTSSSHIAEGSRIFAPCYKIYIIVGDVHE